MTTTTGTPRARIRAKRRTGALIRCLCVVSVSSFAHTRSSHADGGAPAQPQREMLARLTPKQSVASLEPLLSAPKQLLRYNAPAMKELEIDRLSEVVRVNSPDEPHLDYEGFLVDGKWKQFTNTQGNAWNYIKQQIASPVFDRGVIEERQALWRELEASPEQRQRLVQVRLAMIRFLYERRFQAPDGHGNEQVQRLENGKLLVDLVESIEALGPNVTSEPLKKLVRFARNITAEPRFALLRRFVRDIYEPYHLGGAIADLQELLKADSSLPEVKNRHRLNVAARSLLEAADVLKTNPAYAGITPAEPREAGHVDSVQQLAERTRAYTAELLHEMSRRDDSQTSEFLHRNNQRFANVVEYIATTLDEFQAAHVPKVANLEQAPDELGFVLAVARTHEQWSERGVKLVAPRLLEHRQRQTRISGAMNTTLLELSDPKKIIPNDITSDAQKNLFTLTGPNESGKTTYMRSIGQQYWMTHLGMLLPTAEGKPAEVSLTDHILTSLSVTDATIKAESHYRAELERARSILAPEGDEPGATPYSLVLVDEFANGTDHREGVKRTRTVLQHLSRMGTTAYMTTHKHELTELVAKGKLLGGVNLGMEVVPGERGPTVTRKVLRDAVSPSLGYRVAESAGITPADLHFEIRRGIVDRKFSPDDTRVVPTPARGMKGAARGR